MADNFRKLDVWKEANNLALSAYKITKSFPRDEQFALTNQLRRSSVSVPANIAESCGRFGIKDKIQLLMVARGSIYETRSHLSIACDLNYINKEIFDKIDSDYDVLSMRLNAFINHVKSLKNVQSN